MISDASDIIRSAALYRSVAVSGMAKNVGKTETLNFLIRGLTERGIRIGVTSIGTDGESTDRVTFTPKPEITLRAGTIFATAEKDYHSRRICSEILELGDRQTPLGKILISNALGTGKIVLSGPSDMPGIRNAISRMHSLGAETILVDGALFRQSLASPTVTESMVLATGAAVSRTVAGVTECTSRIIRLLTLPEATSVEAKLTLGSPAGVFAITDNRLTDIGISSPLSLIAKSDNLFRNGETLVINGAVTDRILEWLANQAAGRKLRVIIPDFTRVFANPLSIKKLEASGCKLLVARRPNLLGLTLNPVSPDGYRLDSAELEHSLRQMIRKYNLNVPVVDVLR